MKNRIARLLRESPEPDVLEAGVTAVVHRRPAASRPAVATIALVALASVAVLVAAGVLLGRRSY